MPSVVDIEDFLYWAIEFSAKEKGKSHDEEVKYFAKRFHEFVFSYGNEVFLVGEAAIEYGNAREQFKNAPIELIDWIVDISGDDKIALVNFMNWLTPSPSVDAKGKGKGKGNLFYVKNTGSGCPSLPSQGLMIKVFDICFQLRK